MNNKPIYNFDSNSTATEYEITDSNKLSILNFLRYVNISNSNYQLSTEIITYYEAEINEFCRALKLKNPSKRLIFTSGASESISIIAHILRQLIIAKSAKTKHTNTKYSIITTKYEHKCMVAALESLSLICKIIYVEPDVNNQITLNAIKSCIEPNTIFINVMAANNETGIVNVDIPNIAQYARVNNILFNSDVTQYIPNYSLFIPHLSMFLFSAHKFGGPKGVGILYLPEKLADILQAHPFVFGTQQHNLRGGTINVEGNLKMIWALSQTMANRAVKNDALARFKTLIMDEFATDKYLSSAFKVLNLRNQKINTILICVTPLYNSVLCSIGIVRALFESSNIILGVGSACNEGSKMSETYKQLYIDDKQNINDDGTLTYANFIRVSFGDDIDETGVKLLISGFKGLFYIP